MQYLLMLHYDEKAWAALPADTKGPLMAEFLQVTADLKKAGQFVHADGLQPTHTATTVRVRDGKTATTDGPFAETREQLGGYYIIDVPNLDDAIKIAARIPSARVGGVEIRPLTMYPKA